MLIKMLSVKAWFVRVQRGTWIMWGRGYGPFVLYFVLESSFILPIH